MNSMLQQKIKELPTESGVYIMKDINGEIIYVGKAKILKNRVSQYFHSQTNFTPKVKAMVDNIADFEYIVTNNELEAFALENNLIKKYQPYYNILLKDGKAYSYIKINMKQDFPKIEITRQLKKDGAKYFGPYFAGTKASEIVKIICSAFPLKTCNVKITNVAKRPCINYELGLCSAPCDHKIDSEGYHQLLEKAIKFLNGQYEDVAKVLEKKMLVCAENEMFERAIQLRDRLSMVKKLGQTTLTYLNSAENIDIFAWSTNGSNACVAVLIVRGGRSIGCETYHLIDVNRSEQESINQFIAQYYLKAIVPPEIIVPCKVEDILENWLSQRRSEGLGIEGKSSIKIKIALKGKKRKLLEIARKNANLALNKFIESEKRVNDFTVGAVDKLQEILKMDKRPSKMECYDISNISGVFSVASMVVFKEGVPAKRLYRKFKIKTVNGPNDFASMNEVLTRRFNEAKRTDKKDISFSVLPDLIVIDGGKGQLSSAYKAMMNCGVNVQMVGLAKREEELFLPNNPVPIVLPHTHNSLKMLQRIRDESHRFAITFHRSLRNKTESIMVQIPGIGKIKRNKLLKHFKSIDAIKNANIESLMSVEKITKKDADNIFKFFHES